LCRFRNQAVALVALLDCIATFLFGFVRIAERHEGQHRHDASDHDSERYCHQEQPSTSALPGRPELRSLTGYKERRKISGVTEVLC